MAALPSEVCVVYDAFGRGLKVYRHKVVKETAGRLKLAPDSGIAFSCRTFVGPDQYARTPEDAIRRFRQEQAEFIESMRREIAEAEKRLQAPIAVSGPPK